jgi:hypothetical protein
MGLLIPRDQPMEDGPDFASSNCGSDRGTAQCATALAPESGWLVINGSPDLSGCVIGPSGANVTKAFVSDEPTVPLNDYCVWVYGQGPAGIGSGWFELSFTDQSGAVYTLKLYSSTPNWHYAAYNSEAPAITQMSWQPWSVEQPT